MIPDSTKHNPDPEYIRGLLLSAGLNQTEAASILGITSRSMRGYVSDAGTQRAPYLVQFALECLAHKKGRP